MGIEVTTRLRDRLWEILKGGRFTLPLVPGASLLDQSKADYPTRDRTRLDPAAFPTIDIEVGFRGSHSAYTKAPTYALESAEAAIEGFDFEIDRVEFVRITLKTTEQKRGGINPLKEAVLDDLMAAGPRLGMSPLVTGFGPFTHEQRRLRQGETPPGGYLTTITFPITVTQNGVATVRDQE